MISFMIHKAISSHLEALLLSYYRIENLPLLFTEKTKFKTITIGLSLL